MTAARQQQGWEPPAMKNADLRRVRTAREARDLVESAPERSIHLCQGIRRNGLIGVAQRWLARRNLDQWIVMEKVNDAGFMGAVRRVEYRRRLRIVRRQTAGILAIGDGTAQWLVQRGWNERHVYPFAYFLRPPPAAIADKRGCGPYRILFVGRLIRLKRVDLLIEALRRLPQRDVELAVVGAGPLEEGLRRQARAALGGRVIWLGTISMGLVQREMAQADCLVLPSSYDGWGVVVSEALMVGTPVICSDRCGAAEVVRCSGQGGVFKSGDVGALTRRIGVELDRGWQSVASRGDLTRWAVCLGADVGAAYLRGILRHATGDGSRPSVPWSSRRDRESV